MEHLRSLGLLTCGGRGAGGEVSGAGEQRRGFAKQSPQQPKENAFGTAF